MARRERTAIAAISAYEKHIGRYVCDCYKNPSTYKLAAENDIWWEMKRNHGFDYGVISYNVNMFTCGYKMVSEETGELFFVYHTPSYCAVVPYLN